MTDKIDLPEGVTRLLNELPVTDNVKPIGAQHDRPGLKVVPIAEQEGWRDAVKTLRLMADNIENGVDSGIVRMGYVIQREDGCLDIGGMGPLAEDLAVLALLGLGIHQMQSEMLY